MDRSQALLQFVSSSTEEPITLSRSEALAQFIDVSKDDNRCKKCAQELFKKSGPYQDKFFVADNGVPQIQVCETCFDNDIKKRWGYF